MNLKLSLILIFTASVLSAQQIGEGHAPAIIENFSAPLKSGIYNGLNTTTMGMAPDNSNVWQHLFVARHIGTTNNCQFQLASSFAVNDRLFFRKIIVGDLSSPNTNWVELATRGKNLFIGDQSINGNLGIGTETPAAKLDVAGGFYVGNGSVNANTTKVFLRNPAGKTWALSSGANANTESSFSIYNWTDNKSTPVFHIGSAGNIGIGVSNPLNKLDVNGTIHSKEVKVDMDGWADFVFKKDYNLPTLAEVETHIKENGHLENIPNEEEVLKNGISLGEMNTKLLQKIEELTLYVIEQNKQITNLQNRLDKVESNSN